MSAGGHDTSNCDREDPGAVGRLGAEPAGESAEESPAAEADGPRGAAGDDPHEGYGEKDALDAQADRWLVDKARQGDPDAWEVLIRRHRDRIYRIALRMLGNSDDAEDVAQDVVVQLFTAIAGFTGASAFTTWLYRIVINRCINHRQRRRVTRPLSDADHPTTPGPEQAVLARQQVAAAATALSHMPSTLRSALVLHEMEGLSYQEVGDILNLSESTVRGRIFRARRQLMNDLQEWS